ncbi:MAG: hypothetical protein CAPSK01_004443 [Candidatus Accumulibacter vicinus]|uniref:Uncharacterized protein n=1 Tax=Candidatus Accumulibacter vicinus TaxID=2954382 RepID=A0A084XUY8_9PROT|nr:MAG: hypothetical protein CAPSK01_004443 [Candidatus Accumulibacter vicinus]
MYTVDPEYVAAISFGVIRSCIALTVDAVASDCDFAAWTWDVVASIFLSVSRPMKTNTPATTATRASMAAMMLTMDLRDSTLVWVISRSTVSLPTPRAPAAVAEDAAVSPPVAAAAIGAIVASRVCAGGAWRGSNWRVARRASAGGGSSWNMSSGPPAPN